MKPSSSSSCIQFWLNYQWKKNSLDIHINKFNFNCFQFNTYFEFLSIRNDLKQNNCVGKIIKFSKITFLWMQNRFIDNWIYVDFEQIKTRKHISRKISKNFNVMSIISFVVIIFTEIKFRRVFYEWTTSKTREWWTFFESKYRWKKIHWTFFIIIDFEFSSIQFVIWNFVNHLHAIRNMMNILNLHVVFNFHASIIQRNLFNVALTRNFHNFHS